MLVASQGDKAHGCPTRRRQVRPQARWDAAAPVIALTGQMAALELMSPGPPRGQGGEKGAVRPEGLHPLRTRVSAL